MRTRDRFVDINLPQLDVEARRAKINELLGVEKLRQMPNIGNLAEGKPEVMDIEWWNNLNSRFFQDVGFKVAFAAGQPPEKWGLFPIRFNANGGTVGDGAIFVPVINGKPALVYQFRLPIGQWTWELPRGFSEPIDAFVKTGQSFSAFPTDKLPAPLIRELGEEVVKEIQVISCTTLGFPYENTGTSSVQPGCYLIDLKVPEDKLEARVSGTENLKVSLSTWPELMDGDLLNDMHSLAALALANRHMRRISRSGA